MRDRKIRGEVCAFYCSPPSPLSFLGGQGFSFVSRDEVTRLGNLAVRGCVALLSFGWCFCVRTPVFWGLWRTLRRPFWSARLEHLGLRESFQQGEETGEAPPVGFGDPSHHSFSREPDNYHRGFPAPPVFPLSPFSSLQTPSFDSLALNFLIRPWRYAELVCVVT